MKKTCWNCAAQTIDKRCMLGFSVNEIERKPLEECPKPRTYIELGNMLERGGGDYAGKFRSSIASNQNRTV